jgi:hypothetical protein
MPKRRKPGGVLDTALGGARSLTPAGLGIAGSRNTTPVDRAKSPLVQAEGMVAVNTTQQPPIPPYVPGATTGASQPPNLEDAESLDRRGSSHVSENADSQHTDASPEDGIVGALAPIRAHAADHTARPSLDANEDDELASPGASLSVHQGSRFEATLPGTTAHHSSSRSPQLHRPTPITSDLRQTSIATSASPRLASQVQGSPLPLNRALEGEFDPNPNSPQNVQSSPAANPAVTSAPMSPPVRAHVSAAFPGTPISPITPGGTPARPLNLDGEQSPNPHIRRELSTQGRLNLSPELGDQLGSPSAAEQAAEIVSAVSRIDIRNETDRDHVSTVEGDVQRVLSSTPATREEALKKLNATAEKLNNEGDEWRKISYLMLALGGTILALGAASLLVGGSAASAVCAVVGAGLCLAGFGFFHRGNNADPRLPFANVTPNPTTNVTPNVTTCVTPDDTTHYSPIPTGWA